MSHLQPEVRPEVNYFQEPLAYGAIFDESANTIIYIGNRHELNTRPKHYEAPTAMNFHVIHTYEQDNKVSHSSHISNQSEASIITLANL